MHGPLKKSSGGSKSLKDLALSELGVAIQGGSDEHSPIEDAKTAMQIYKKHRASWEGMRTLGIDDPDDYLNFLGLGFHYH